VLLEIGRRIGVRQLAEEGENASKGLGATEGAIFGLLGLIPAFPFSGALTRFNARQHLVVVAPAPCRPFGLAGARRAIDANGVNFAFLSEHAPVETYGVTNRYQFCISALVAKKKPANSLRFY
jgi:hypothetical protein